MSRQLGKRQASALEALTRKGRYPGGGWEWSNPSTTRQILDSLVRAGRATKDDQGVYRAVKQP